MRWRAAAALAAAAGVAAAAEPPALFSAPAETVAGASGFRAALGRVAGHGARPRIAAEVLSRLASADLRSLAEAQRAVKSGAPAELALDLFTDVSLTAVLERTATTRRGYSLSGRVEGEEQSAVTLVANGDMLYGTVWTSAAGYEIRTVGGGMQAIERQKPSSWRCEGSAPRPPGLGVGGWADGAAGVAPALSEATAQAAGAEAAAEDDGGDDGSVVDLAVFYLPSARLWAGGQRATLAMLDHHVAWINDAYARSEVDLRIEMVAAVELEEPPHGTKMFRFEQYSEHPYLDEFHAVREAYAADMWAVGVAGWGGVCCSVWGIGSASTLAHELGHDLGLGHERQDFGYRGRFPYSHGYRFELDGKTYWTIMANIAGSGELPRFSNPRHRHLGHPLGVPGEQRTDDVDGPADAARSLNETRRDVARRRRSAHRCAYRLVPEAADIPAEGGAFSVEVEADAGCAWTARAVDGVATLKSGASGVGSGRIEYRVPANAGWEREVALAVAGEMHVGVQPGTRPLKPVCERSAAVREALSAEVGLPCEEVSATELAAVGELKLGAGLERGVLHWRFIPAPAPGDLDGLVNLGQLTMGIRRGDTLPAGVFDGLANLQGLWVRGGAATWDPIALEVGVFDGLFRLYSLRLREVTGIRPGVFRGLSRLDSLGISDSDLSRLRPGTFGELSSLVQLFFSDITGLSLPPGVFAPGLNEMQTFYASADPGIAMDPLEPGVFEGLPKLWAVSFYNFEMSELHPGVFRGVADSLGSLNLVNAGLSNLEAGVFDGLDLWGVHLSNYWWYGEVRNELPTLPPGLFRGLPLRYLGLQGVGLTALDPAWYEDIPPTLRRLNLRDNRLSELPADLMRTFPDLRVLELAENRLRALPERFFAGNGVERLSLHDNPGAPFVLKVEPKRTPGDYRPGHAHRPRMALHLAQGAPAWMDFRLSAAGGRLRPYHARLHSGETRSTLSDVLPDGVAPVVVRAELDTDLTPGPCDEDTFLNSFKDHCLTGLRVEVGGPLVLNGVQDTRLATDDRPWRVALENVFLEFPMAGTTYAAESSDPSVVEAAVEGGELAVTPHGKGAATIAITATFLDGRTATRTFSAAVQVANQRPFLRGWRLGLLDGKGP